MTIEHAVRRIDMVLDSSFEPSTAYPLRARLGRAVLAASKALSADLDFTEASELPYVINRLQAAAKHVMQPSEPFDDHWRGQWAEVLTDLRSLRSALEDIVADDLAK